MDNETTEIEPSLSEGRDADREWFQSLAQRVTVGGR